jgi:O-antigen/teichoic acid export membrane protein
MAAVISARLMRKVSWNLVDQALSAASNFALAILVARSVNASEFGAFSVAFLAYGITVAATKSMVGQPLQMRFSSAESGVQRTEISSGLGFVLPTSIAVGIVLAVIGLVLPGATASSLIALAVVLPALLVQDSCRMAMFTVGKPAWAAAIDAVWAVGQFAAIGLLVLLGRTEVWLFILAWGVAAGASAAVGLVLLRVRPVIRRAASWFGSQRHLIRYLFPEYLLGLGAAQFGLLLVGVVASADAVGSIRAAQVLLGPLGIVGSAAFQFAVPEMAARPGMSSRQRAVFGLGISAALGAITAVYCAGLLLMPDRFGTALFGDSWAGASAVLLAMCLASLASSQANGPAGVLYAMGRAQWTFRINLVKGPFALVTLLTGAALWAATGAAWAFFLIELEVLPAWLLTFRKAVVSGEVVGNDLEPALARG